MRKEKRRMSTWIYIIIGALLILETLVVSFASNYNLGVVMPAIIGAPLLVYGLFRAPLDAWMASSALGAIVKWAVIGAYALLAVAVIVCTVLIQSAANKRPADGADAIIVLGAAVHGDEPALVLKKRLDTAREYWQSNPEARIIVSGGMGSGENVTEASAMKKYLVEKGVPARAVIEEDRSTSTLENFRFSKEILNQIFPGEYRAVFVTTSFHVYRAEIAAQAEGLDAKGMAAPFDWYMALNYYLRETAALVRYFLIGLR